MKKIKTIRFISVMFIISLVINLIFIKVNLNMKQQNNVINDSINIKNNNIENLECQIDSLNIVNDSIMSEFDILIQSYIEQNELRKFFNDISLRESSGDHMIVNSYGMLGLYQFNITTLKGLGVDYSKTEFLNSRYIQNYAMLKYLKYNKKILNYYINKYDGVIYDGIYITASGILAGAHLTGPGGVMEFFDNNGKYKTVDGNGVNVREYISEFSGYNILSFL